MGVRLLAGHVLNRLAELADNSVHCVVTSPPYWGLRDYKIPPQVWGGKPGCAHDFAVETLAAYSSKGHWQQAANGEQLATGKIHSRHKGDLNSAREQADSKIERGFCRCGAWRGSLGLEPEPALYVEHMVEVFREVRRVLRRDGTLWLNIGDSYAAQHGQRKETDKAGDKQRSNTASTGTPSRCVPGIKPKDMIGIPWMLAFALRADGWWLRSEITWAKRAPMPESVTDRPTMATEKVFLLAKSARYFYDAAAVKEDMEVSSVTRVAQATRSARNGLENLRDAVEAGQTKRNMRNWWLLGPEPFPESHFAVFPTEIPRRAILAGTSAKGCCPKCGAPWDRVGERESRPNVVTGVLREVGGRPHRNPGGGVGNDARKASDIGWRPTCRCAAGAPIAATVLDPFLGAGTTALVADRLGRNCIGIELSPDYVAMGERRLRADAPLFLELAAE